jgi:hypothetical protein
MLLLALVPTHASAQTFACQMRYDMRALPDVLDLATALYRERNSELPASAHDLVLDGELRRVPVEPSGEPYVLTVNRDGTWNVHRHDGGGPPTAWDCFRSERSASSAQTQRSGARTRGAPRPRGPARGPSSAQTQRSGARTMMRGADQRGTATS